MARNSQEELQLWQSARPAEFSPDVASSSEVQALVIKARQGAGFPVAAGQIGHAVQSRATHVLMDFSASSCALRYQVDGQWEQLPPLDRETGDAMLVALKQLCLLNPADRRSAQSGKCGIKIKKDKYRLTIQSQGVKSGERVLIRLTPENVPFDRLEHLGMREKMIESFREQLNAEGNLVLISAPKGEGLSTTWNVALNAADRFVRDFQSLELKDAPEPDVININANFYGAGTELTEIQLVNKLILKEPDTLVFPSVPSPESMSVLSRQIERANKQVLTRIVAGSAIEAAARFISQYPDLADDLSTQITAVLCQKLVRRLCDNCKVGFEPTPQLLNQLGIPAGRVGMLYQPFILPPIEQQVDENGKPAPITPCHVCEGRGFHSRCAVFELLCPGKQLQKALVKTRDLAKLAEIARAEGFRNLKAEAVLTVARGLTSLDELKRTFAKR